jgi:hypothetical protein
MFGQRKLVISLLMLVLSTGFTPEMQKKPKSSYPPSVGIPHPDFILPDIETGAPVSLSQYRGRKVLLINLSSW